MESSDLRAASGRSTSGPALWLRVLAAPMTGLLLLSLCAGLAPATAHAKTLSITPANGEVATLASSRTSSKTIVNIKVPSSLPFFAAVQLRSADERTGYRAKVSVATNGALTVSLARVVGGVETLLGTPMPTGSTVTAGKTLRLQGAIAGANPVRLYVRAWKSGSKTPKWRLAALDYTTARITTAGKTRLWGYLPSTATGTANISYSKVSTSSTTVKKIKAYKVQSKVSVGAPATAAAQTSTSGKPSATTTGVKAGSTLTRHDGDITITKDGTVLSNLDIHGFVTVRAKNVTISNSIVRGGKSKGVATGLITNYGFSGLVISDVRIVPEFPSVYFDGIKGSEFTARRVHISGGVDSVKIHGNNVTIENSLLEKTTYYASDPQQGGGATHNDNVQILNGTNLRITGSTIRGATNFAVLGAASKGNTNLVLANNWLDGGHCTVKLQILNGYSETATVTGNKFGPNRKVSSCAFTAYPAVKLTQSGNTYELTGSIVTPLLLVS